MFSKVILKTKNPTVILLFVVGLLFFGLTTRAEAAIYYVSVADGDDTNCTGLAQTPYVSGSAQPCPWKTLAKVSASTFSAGDSILFKRGETFTGNLQFANETGTSENRITIGAYGTGVDPILTASSGRTLDIRNSASYMTFENLTLRSAVSDNIFLFSGTFDNLIFRNLDIASSSAFTTNTATTTNMLFSNVIIHDVTTGIINLNFGTNDTFENVSISNVTNGAGITLGSAASATTSGITFDNVSITNVAGNGIGIRKLSNSNFSNITIASSSLSGIGIDLGLSNVSFTNINISSTTQFGMSLNATGDVNITNATTTTNGLDGINIRGTGGYLINNLYSSYNSGGHGIIWSGSAASSYLLLSDSIFEYNGGPASQKNGLSFDGAGNATTTNTVARYNTNDGFNLSSTVHAVFDSIISDTNGIDGIGANGDGLSWHSASTGVLKNSIIRNNKKGGVVNVQSSHVDVYNNVFIHSSVGTLPMFYLEGSSTANVYNNTFINLSQQGTALLFTHTASGVIKNNLIYGFDIGLYNNTAGTFTESNNYVWSFGTTPFINLTPDLTSSSISNPLLTDVDNENYMLSSASPAINAGTDVGLTRDYAGNSIMGNPDIGAYEYQWISPVSSFSSSVSARTASFTDTSTDLDGTISAWSWNFGDGDTSSSQNPEHSYTENGTYTVTLTVTDNHGAQSTTTSSVTINYSNPSGSSRRNLLPTLTIASTTTPTTTHTIEYLKKRVAELQKQLELLTGQITAQNISSFQFARNLSINMTGEDVRSLQQFLNNNGFIVSSIGAGSPGQETTLFGTLTYNALKNFQASVGLPSTGYFGPMTREYINKK